MSRLLKQSTAFTFRIGPFVDDTDFKTAETGLTIAQADLQISKDGAAFAQTSAAPTTTHDADGWYQCPLTTTDTGTLGPLTVQIVVAGALPVWDHFMVVPANVYDSLVDGADSLEVDATAISGDATAADNAEAFFDGTGYAGTNNVIPTVTTLTGHTNQTADHTAGIADVPTVAEFNARTLVAASYFDPAADTVATVTTVTNQLTQAEIESECNDALVALKLDHLVAVADSDDVADDSIMAKIASTDGDWSGYSKITDSLETQSFAFSVLNTAVAGVQTAVDALNDMSVAELRTALGTNGSDVIAELAQGKPSSTPSMAAALMLLYMQLRNALTSTATSLTISNDAGAVITKATLSDDATTFTKAELATGP